LNGGVIVGNAIVARVSYNLKCDDFVDPTHKLKNIYKVYQHQFHSLGREEK